MLECKHSERLIKELAENRKKLYNMISSVEGLRDKLEELLPQKIDFRSKWMIPERMKTVSEIIKNELSVRKQIDDSIKLESDLRLKNSDSEDGLITENIKTIAKAMEQYQKEKELEQQNLENHANCLSSQEEQQELIEIDSTIVSPSDAIQTKVMDYPDLLKKVKNE